MRCPGQDRRYWKQDAVFEVPCPECGAAVEFFKDESSGRCGACGHRFPNPGIDFGCAGWCSLAQQCVGFVPERALTAESREGALAGRLIGVVKEALAGQPTRLAHAMRVYRFARRLAAQEGADPRVVLAAALLLQMEPDPAAPAGGTVKAEQVLRQIGADDETVRRVCAIVEARRAGHAPGEQGGLELKIVGEAEALARSPNP